MSQLTFGDLAPILIQCAGQDETVSLDGDVLDTSFADLGYDSLALLETAAAIERRFGARLRDEDVADVATPRDFLDLVNGAISGTH